MLRSRVRATFDVAASLLVSIALGGCASTVAQMNASQLQASSYVADHVPAWAGGEPQNLPARPAVPPAYPNVFATPQPHEQKLLTDAEEKRDEAALIAAREGTAAQIRTVAAAEQKRAAEASAMAAARAQLAEQQAGMPSSN